MNSIKNSIKNLQSDNRILKENIVNLEKFLIDGFNNLNFKTSINKKSIKPIPYEIRSDLDKDFLSLDFYLKFNLDTLDTKVTKEFKILSLDLISNILTIYKSTIKNFNEYAEDNANYYANLFSKTFEYSENFIEASNKVLNNVSSKYLDKNLVIYTINYFNKEIYFSLSQKYDNFETEFRKIREVFYNEAVTYTSLSRYTDVSLFLNLVVSLKNMLEVIFQDSFLTELK